MTSSSWVECTSDCLHPQLTCIFTALESEPFPLQTMEILSAHSKQPSTDNIFWELTITRDLTAETVFNLDFQSVNYHLLINSIMLHRNEDWTPETPLH